MRFQSETLKPTREYSHCCICPVIASPPHISLSSIMGDVMFKGLLLHE